MLRQYEHPEVGRLTLMGQPIGFSETPPADAGRPPTLGEHTDEVLREIGYGPSEIAELRAEGAIRRAEAPMGTREERAERAAKVGGAAT
jgi:crotonobetainyl-CoA:carnitine CoA-transferase CaiB-like acyl-CoA transferase